MKENKFRYEKGDGFMMLLWVGSPQEIFTRTVGLSRDRARTILSPKKGGTPREISGEFRPRVIKSHLKQKGGEVLKKG